MNIDRHKTFRFIVTGIAATGISVCAFRWAYSTTHQALLSTLIRLTFFAPIAYLGYSRWMLLDLLRTEQRTLGVHAAELRMLGRITTSIGLSTLAKLLIEPLLTTFLLRVGGPSTIGLAPLMGDLGYGPIINYGVLMLTSKRAAPTLDSSVHSASL